MKFDYYYGTQADQFSFVKIPRLLLTEETFGKLTLQSKMLYSILLDRMTLSMKNEWFDEENRAFIIYPISEIQSDLGFSKKKAMDYLTELEEFGLVEKKKRGFGLPSILYVKSFMIQESCARGAEKVTSMEKRDFAGSVENSTTEVPKTHSGGVENSTTEVPKTHSGGVENSTSEVPKSHLGGDEIGTTEVPKSHLGGDEIGTSEVPKSIPLISKTKENNTERSQIKSNHILSAGADDAMRNDGDEMAKAYEEIIKKNIAFDDLLITHPYDQEAIQGIADLILETVVSQSDTILIASKIYPAQMVKSKFLHLNYRHVEYVMECLNNNNTNVKNIKKYMLAALFNAPTTIDGYYRAKVNADHAQATECITAEAFPGESEDTDYDIPEHLTKYSKNSPNGYR